MLALVNARLIDGTGSEPVEIAAIIIEGERIREVGRGTGYLQGAQGIDVKGMTVMPGLIDCHLHLGGFVTDKPDWQFSFFDILPFFVDYFRNFALRRKLAIENGVTTIRSAGDNYPHIIKLRDKIQSGKLIGPRIVAPGPIFTAPGGHPAGTIYKRNRYIVEHATRQVSDPETARVEVRKLAEGGVDCIKAIYDDIDLMDLTNKLPRLSFDVLKAIVDEAHQQNLRAMVHTGRLDEVRDAVDAGADSIEHGILPGGLAEYNDELVQTMLDKGTYYVPTLCAPWAFRATYPEALYKAQKAVKQLHDKGVKIALGTDSGLPSVKIGAALHKELELLVEAGLTPIEAIMAGTRNAAENLGKGSDLGTVEEGKLADIIAVSGDPLEQISDTRRIQMVIKSGKILVNRLGKH